MSNKLRKHTRIDVRDAELIAYYSHLEPRPCQVLDFGIGGARCLLKTTGMEEVSARMWIAALMMREELEFELSRVSNKRLRASVRHTTMLKDDLAMFGLEFKPADDEARVWLERARVLFHQDAIKPGPSTLPRVTLHSETELEREPDSDSELVEIITLGCEAKTPPGRPYEVVGQVEVISYDEDDETPRPYARQRAGVQARKKLPVPPPPPPAPPTARRAVQEHLDEVRPTTPRRPISSRRSRIVMEPDLPEGDGAQFETIIPPVAQLAEIVSAIPVAMPVIPVSPVSSPVSNDDLKVDPEKSSARSARRRADAARAAAAKKAKSRQGIAGFFRGIISRFSSKSSDAKPDYRSMRLGEILRTINYCTEYQIDDWTRRAIGQNMKLGQFLVHEKIVTQRELFRILSLQSGLPLVNLKEAASANSTSLLSRKHCREMKIAPFNAVGKTLYVACSQRLSDEEVRRLEIASGRSIKLFLAADSELDSFMESLEDASSAGRK